MGNRDDDLVDVSDGTGDNIHVVIISRKFDGRRMKEKNDLIRSVLVEFLSGELLGTRESGDRADVDRRK